MQFYYYPRSWEAAAESSVSRDDGSLDVHLRRKDETIAEDSSSTDTDTATTYVTLAQTVTVTTSAQVTATESSADVGVGPPLGFSVVTVPKTVMTTKAVLANVGSSTVSHDKADSTATDSSAHTTATSQSVLTSFPSPSWSSAAHSTSGYSPCPDGYSYYHCGYAQAQFIFNGCCKVNPCQMNAYCPRWAFAVAAGDPNTYNQLTVNEEFTGQKTQAVMTSKHVIAGSTTIAEKFTVNGPFLATASPYTATASTATGTGATTAVASKSSGLSGGAAAGIIVGVIVGVLALVGVGLFWWWRRRRARMANEALPSTSRHFDAGPVDPSMANMQYKAYNAVPQEGLSPDIQPYDQSTKSPMGAGFENNERYEYSYQPEAELPGNTTITPIELPANRIEVPATPPKGSTELNTSSR